MSDDDCRIWPVSREAIALMAATLLASPNQKYGSDAFYVDQAADTALRLWLAVDKRVEAANTASRAAT